MSLTTSFFSRPYLVFTTATVFRLILLLYGRWQDANSPVKYTDIDYLVFTDAARFVAQGGSPYDRATYRYTPLLAWLLYPTSFGGYWFEFGKALFAAGDVVTGWLILLILRRQGMEVARAMKFASIWLLNPMVANISTRGSSEGLVAVIVVALLWAALERRYVLAGVLLGLGVHVKLYPFIYAASIFWWMDSSKLGSWQRGARKVPDQVTPFRILETFFNRGRLCLAIFSFIVFMGLNLVMYAYYQKPFLTNTFFYHFTRIDHRHNFSVYNTVLHLNSAQKVDSSGFRLEEVAFIPQMFLSVVALPLLLAKKDLASTMLAQTFAFVTFNKVCTSQYFLWYMVFLPFYLPNSSMLQNPRLGITALVAWIAGQGLWLQQGFELEFLGKSTFVPGLWFAGAIFFLINCWILGIIVADIRTPADSVKQVKKVE
ncbi:GPI mannosyltransferase 1-like protein [Acrodontium crateriforme]|uniref:GPI mannosyltransferase 1 n=1 Tax=Acrodontium crateriforme TaxID=150365 RepID=A0AAQ3R8W2_9PEZI|nr:GPI mannosyltransferase 1-like protein [Acrodontium crateriforme]